MRSPPCCSPFARQPARSIAARTGNCRARPGMSLAVGGEVHAAQAGCHRQSLSGDRGPPRSRLLRGRSRPTLAGDRGSRHLICDFRGVLDCLRTGDELSHAPLEVAARQQHAPAAGLAFDANISAEPHDTPIKPATRVRFLEPHHVTDGKRDRLRVCDRSRLCGVLHGGVADLAGYISPGIRRPPVTAPIFSSARALARFIAS